MTVEPATEEVSTAIVDSTSAPRWHDLDALRGFAMLLGIALHAALSFFPGFWIVVDSEAESDGWFDEFFHAVHGIRMPLFFLLSGFFTTMLWRRRGPRRLVEQRLKRIALPLAVFVERQRPSTTVLARISAAFGIIWIGKLLLKPVASANPAPSQ